MLHLFRKNYSIDSEGDIPENIREEVMRRIDGVQDQNHPISITPGKVGDIIFSENQLSDVFNNEETLYWGHGTPGDDEVINSILQMGLKVKDPKAVAGYGFHLEGLTSTAVILGLGKDDLFDTVSEQLNNWPHKNSENIVIISLPKEYLLPKLEISSNVDAYEQFYIGNEEDGYKLRPEFIRGVYNSVNHSFTFNENFYENFPDEKKGEFFNELDNSYIQSYAEKTHLTPDELERKADLDDSKLNRLSIEYYAVQLKRMREDKKELETIKDEIQEAVEESEDSDWVETDGWR